MSDLSSLSSSGRIRDHDELSSIYGRPARKIVNKVSNTVNAESATFLAAASMLFMSTYSTDGRCDVTPRGGAPGFVKLLSDAQLAIPDVMGNKRLDSMHNIIDTGRAGLFFIIPGRTDGLRMNGEAWITADEQVLALFDPEVPPPSLAIVLEVNEVFVHCFTAFTRGLMWEPDRWPRDESVPSMSELWKSHLRDNGFA